MLNSHCLKDNNILIYGTGGNGIELYHRLHHHHSIFGFIDKRADEIRDNFERPVFTLQEISHRLSRDEKENMVVIIAIKNVFIHSEIASELLHNGFSYLIYKPLNILKNRGNETEIQINEIYEYMVEKRQCMMNISIPQTKEILFQFENKLLINKNEDEIVTWLPIEILFNYKYSNDFPGINMPLFFPLVELYRAFMGDMEISLSQAIDNFYLYSCEWLYQNKRLLTETQKNSLLESRRQIFSEMQKMAEVDIDFFKENAPLVEKDGKRFYMKSSGRNRVAFLIAKGFKYVPVRMDQADYEEWCDFDLVHKKELDIKEKKINCFFAPYPNPYLVDYPIYFTDYQRLFLQSIANEITKEIYLKNVISRDGINRIAFDCVERDKEKTIFLLRVNDDGIAREYFLNIGFLVDDPNIPNNNMERILVLDSEACFDSHTLLSEVYFKRIYYLQRGIDNSIISFFEKYGYRLDKEMFESVCKDNIIRGMSFMKDVE